MCKFAVNVYNDPICKVEDTALTFNKIAPNLEEKDMTRSENVKKKFRRLKKVPNKKI